MGREKIEVTSVGRLENAAPVQSFVAALGHRWRCKGVEPTLDLGLIDKEVDALTLDRQSDPITISDSRERSSYGSLRRDMQHDGAESGSRHTRIGDAHHVFHACLRELLWNGQITCLRHTRPVGAGILQHEHIVRCYIKLRIIDTGAEVAKIL